MPEVFIVSKVTLSMYLDRFVLGGMYATTILEDFFMLMTVMPITLFSLSKLIKENL